MKSLSDQLKDNLAESVLDPHMSDGVDDITFAKNFLKQFGLVSWDDESSTDTELCFTRLNIGISKKDIKTLQKFKPTGIKYKFIRKKDVDPSRNDIFIDVDKAHIEDIPWDVIFDTESFKDVPCLELKNGYIDKHTFDMFPNLDDLTISGNKIIVDPAFRITDLPKVKRYVSMNGSAAIRILSVEAGKQISLYH